MNRIKIKWINFNNKLFSLIIIQIQIFVPFYLSNSRITFYIISLNNKNFSIIIIFN